MAHVLASNPNAGPPTPLAIIGFVIVVLALVGWNLWLKFGGKQR